MHTLRADGTLGVVAAQDLPAAQLLCCVPPLVFLKGGLGAPPAVEDLHVELLEAPLRPAEQQVLCLLPRKPLPPPPPPATLSVVPDADGVEVAVTNGEAAGHEQHQQQEQPQPQPQQQPQQSEERRRSGREAERERRGRAAEQRRKQPRKEPCEQPTERSLERPFSQLSK